MKKNIFFLFLQPHYLKAFNPDQGFNLLDAVHMGKQEANQAEEAAKLKEQKRC